jgi:DNA-directed RNA polymerase subunit M/transcription elongation factor TFIIS
MTRGQKLDGTKRQTVPKIPCPYCGESNSKVMNTRPALAQEGVKRTRQCKSCKKPYRTVEILETRIHLDDSPAA